MFLDFYKLKEQPFGVTPDPHFLYLSGSHREALASLFYGVETGRGLMALVAPPGMGKTTLLFRLLGHLKRSARTAFLFQTQCDSLGLMRYLMGDLGIDTRGQDFVTMHEQLNDLLIREANSGKRFVLVIDEAQNLDDAVLETARLLSDFETPSKKLLQIIFAGQPQLAEKLQRPELAQLRQRISILGRLEPFNTTEVIHYINHRLRVAGHSSDSLFTPEAFERIAASSRGIPRSINMLCFSALSLGCALGRMQIDDDLIRAAEADLDLGSLADERWREVLPAPTSLGGSAAEVKMCFGSVATNFPSHVGNAPFEELAVLDRDPAGTEKTSQLLDVWHNEITDGLAADQLILESLEHAQARNAEILAEIVVDEVSGHAYFMNPQDYDASSKVTKAAFQETECRLEAPYHAKRDHSFGRLAVVASVFVLALFVAIFYRQDLGAAAAQTRDTLSRTTAKIAPRLIANEAELVAPGATTEQMPKLFASVLSGQLPWTTKVLSATKNSIVATLADVSLNSAKERGPERTFTPSAIIKPVAQFADGTTVVIVQPNDDLRQICLRHFGRYDTEVLHEIRKFNPEISDPDRITVGQRIILSTLASVSTNASRFPAVPKQ
jgi:general secretion pathway protein A